MAQRFIFTHHKSGTVLLNNVLRGIAAHAGLSVVSSAQRLASPPHYQIVIFEHSGVGFDLSEVDFRGVHVVRDPRDIWVSGYLYHLKTTEAWCTNTHLALRSRVEFPQVPYSQEHRPEAWKRAYLEGLGGRSYQDNLKALDRKAGLRFELDRYAGWTIQAMADWTPLPDRILETSMEEISGGYPKTMRKILTHLQFPPLELPQLMAIAGREDISRMSDSQIAENPHIHARKLSKWRDFLDADDLAYFNERFGDVVEKLGYEPA